MDDLELKLAAVARPGDALILEVVNQGALTQGKADEIRARITEMLPGIKVAFLAGGLSVGAVFREKDLV